MTATTPRPARRTPALLAALLTCALLLPLAAARAAEPSLSPPAPLRLLYSTDAGWSAYHAHHRVDGGSWTTAPGPRMTPACPGWVQVDLPGAAGRTVTVAFTDGAGRWDNNGSRDYTLTGTVAAVRDGRVSATDPCGPATTTTATVHYSTAAGWSAYHVHHRVGTGPWTTVPGDRMSPACDGWVVRSITVPQGATVTAAFTDGAGRWDNNGSRDYTVPAGPTTVRDGTVTAGSPCAGAGEPGEPEPDPTDPEPTDPGEPDPNEPDPGEPGPTDPDPGEDLPAPSGTPLGGDPREDPIYFVMTARWADGDASNNRGGNQHVRSGNAANDDPMFRGDFKGLIDNLDYIKGLGFSAIWITPVVLNRSDYDFHGYHGWDFYRVDPRLESPGASYQDLIDAAHSRGIKIYQDVVYNHSSRWGAKDFFTPTVFGTRDADWSWYYDAPEPGRQYDPLEEDADGSTYNGDLWSATQPAGQGCASWGVPMGWSPEGQRTYHCQWPNATSGMFPADKYHQCWIGNWEGKDSQDCWIHEDLADFNTEDRGTQQFLIDVYNRYIDMGVDGFRIDTAVHVPRVMWNRHFLPAIRERAVAQHGEKGEDFYVFGEVAQFVHDRWNRGSVNHSAPFYTWTERREYSLDDVVAAAEQFQYENLMGTGGQPTSDNEVLRGNSYHAPDHSRSSGMSIIDMRMHMNFSSASNAFHSGMDSDPVTNDGTFNVVYVDSHDYGPNKSAERFAGGTDAWAENMSLMWTFRGVPTLYYGSEIEFQAGARIDCGPTCPLATTGRAYFGDHLEGSVRASDFGVVSSASGPVAQTLQHPLVQHVQRLNRIRRAVPALQKGQYSTEGVSGDMAFKRRFTGDGVDSFVLVAVSGPATFTGIPDGTYVDAVTGDRRTVTDGSLAVPVSGKGNLRAYVLELPGNPAPGKVGDTGPFLR